MVEFVGSDLVGVRGYLFVVERDRGRAVEAFGQNDVGVAANAIKFGKAAHSSQVEGGLEVLQVECEVEDSGV